MVLSTPCSSPASSSSPSAIMSNLHQAIFFQQQQQQQQQQLEANQVLAERYQQLSGAVSSIVAPPHSSARRIEPTLFDSTQQQQTQEQEVISGKEFNLVLEPEHYHTQKNNSHVQVLVRGARDNKFDDLMQLKELNSLPYKYQFKVIIPSSIPAVNQQDLHFKIVCLDNDQQRCVEIQDGLVIDKFVRMREFVDRREFEYKLHMVVYSHSFSRSSFFIQIYAKSTGTLIYQSNKFYIFARRKKRAIIGNKQQSPLSSSMMSSSPNSSSSIIPPEAKRMKVVTSIDL